MTRVFRKDICISIADLAHETGAPNDRVNISSKMIDDFNYKEAEVNYNVDATHDMILEEDTKANRKSKKLITLNQDA